jgi:AcrR family transcriptional regulator
MNRDSDPPTSLRERIRAVKRAAIIEAAEQIFASQGLHGARMEDVAAAAGVAVGTVYNHIGDRQALLDALIETRQSEFLARLDEAARGASAQPFEQQLEAFVRAALEHSEKHRSLLTLLTNADINLVGGKARRSLRTEIARRAQKLLQRGVAQGAIMADGAELYPALLAGMLGGLHLRSLLTTRPEPLTSAVSTLVRLFLHGAGGRR